MGKEEAKKLASAAMSYGKTSEIPELQEVIIWAFIAGAKWQEQQSKTKI